VGYGTTVQRVEQRIETSGLRDVIVRMPFAKSVGPLLAASDVLVFPATAPHFARPVIEAASFAVPAVASRLDGIDELIAHDDTGLLVPPLDAGALADAMRRLLRDQALRERMGRRAAEVAMERFSADRACITLMSIYDDVLSPVPEQTVA
jgi:glycosyltransferase involved in cell wall biosynthesis